MSGAALFSEGIGAGFIGAPGWIQVRSGSGFGLLIGDWSGFKVDLTFGALDLYPVRSMAKEEYKGVTLMPQTPPLLVR